MKSIIFVKHLSVHVQNKPILKNLSLSIEPGSMHVLMGPNGSGKSTFAHTLAGDPSCVVKCGSVFFDGVDFLKLSPDERARSGLFLAFQHPPAIEGLSVFSFLKSAYNARFGKNIGVNEFRELLYKNMAVLNMDQRFAFRDLNVGFSGGEKKRLELLQLLVLKPKLAILDEIDSGVDVDALNFIIHGIEVARKENSEMALIIISHYQKTIEKLKPDHIHIFCDGTIIESGGIECARKINQAGYNAFT